MNIRHPKAQGIKSDVSEILARFHSERKEEKFGGKTMKQHIKENDSKVS